MKKKIRKSWIMRKAACCLLAYMSEMSSDGIALQHTIVTS